MMRYIITCPNIFSFLVKGKISDEVDVLAKEKAKFIIVNYIFKISYEEKLIKMKLTLLLKEKSTKMKSHQ